MPDAVTPDPFAPPPPGPAGAASCSEDTAHPLYTPTTEHERTYALFTHLTMLSFLVSLPVVPALILWLIKRETSAFIDDHGKEAVNFQISIFMYLLATGILGFITCGAGWILLLACYALALVGMVLAAVAARHSRLYRYPMCIRFIR